MTDYTFKRSTGADYLSGKKINGKVKSHRKRVWWSEGPWESPFLLNTDQNLSYRL